MTEVSQVPAEEATGSTADPRLSVPLVTTVFAGLGGFAVLKNVEGQGPDAVSLELSEAIPTATGTKTGVSANHSGTEIAPLGEIGIVAGPMVLAAVVTTLWARWRHSTSR